MSTIDSVAEANIETLQQFVAEVWTGQNIDAVPEFVADEYVGRDPAYPKPIRGPEGYTEYVRDSLAAFPDLQLEYHTILADGDHIMSRYTVSGTQTGRFGPLPPTGRYVEIEGMADVYFANGRIIKDQVFFDSAVVRRQLGLTFPTSLVTLPRLALKGLRNRL